MAGRQVDHLFPHSPRQPGDVALEVRDLAGLVLPTSATLALRRGEVVGIAGLAGAGRTELLRAIFGLDAVRSGQVRVGASVGPASPTARLAQGVGFLSEDRTREALALPLSIADNLTLSKLGGLGPGPLVLPSRQREASKKWVADLGIRCRDTSQPAWQLSGGNQQKVALGRLLYHDVDVLLLDEPTRGIDVGSKAQIYDVIDRLAAAGKAVLLVSSYLPELLGVCDRIAVMRRGILGPARPVGELTEHAVLMEATGLA
jgi:ribose transport system ATP-binding protein